MIGNGNWCIHLSQLLAKIGYATGENSLGLVIVIVNSLPPNFVPPVAADRTADPGGHLRREGASDGLSSNQVGRLSSSDCRCQHDALVYLKSADLLPKKNGSCEEEEKRRLCKEDHLLPWAGAGGSAGCGMQKRDGFDRAGSKVNGAKKVKVPLLTRKFTFLLIGIAPKNRRYLSDPGKLASRPLQRFCHCLDIIRDNRG